MTGQPGLRTPSAGFDRRWTKIPYQRLHAVDLYNMLDWVREGWELDEMFVTARLQQLEWHLQELPEPHRTEALFHYAILTQARIVNDTPWLEALSALRRTVLAWAEARTAATLSI